MALKNEHHDEIYNANVEWEGFTFQAPMTEPEQGCIVPGGVSTYNSIPFAVPPQVTVTWRTTDGKHHTQIVQITPDLVPGNHDILAFVFRKDNTVGVKRLAPSDFGKLLDPE
ncbi:hypothetical protein [Fontivita pretiosa]|uniref:hypothetical protein n=1 Tax=Fontivita pretiosa TaxID=2989684 RepID=UPI003D179809